MTSSESAVRPDPEVVVYFCEFCHLRKPANEIAVAVRERLGIAARVEEAFWGTFRVEVNGREVYNRWKADGFLARIGFGRLPTIDEAVNRVQAELDGSR